MLAGIVTLLVVLAALAMLLMNVMCTGMFTDSPPQGERAMGLIVPLFTHIGAVAALTVAALLAACLTGSGAVGVIAPTPLLASVLAVVLTVGAALAPGMAFMLWCEAPAVARSLKVVTVPIGLLAGVLGPVVLAAMLLVGVWMPRSEAAGALASSSAQGVALRAGFVGVVLLAIVGYGLGGAMLWKDVQRRAMNRAAAIAEVLKEQARWVAEERKTPRQRLSDELAGFSPDSPLWPVIAYLPERPDARPLDDECREIVVQRALQVEDLDTQVADCMQGRYYIYRQAAAEFIALAPQANFDAHRDAWGRALLLGLKATGDGIACRPAWLSETFDSKPDPLGHVGSLLKAAQRFRSWSEYQSLRQRLQQMADDAGMLNTNADRAKLLRMLERAGFPPREVRP